jgi:hypothetical protein
VNYEKIKSLSTRFKNEKSTLIGNIFKIICESIATVRLIEFHKILYDEFRANKPVDSLITLLFESKRLFKHYDNRI